MACPQLAHFLVAAGAAGFSLAFFVFFIAAHSCLVATGCGAVTHPHNWTAYVNVIKFSCRSCSRRPKPSGSVHTRYKPRTKNQVRDRVLSSAWMWATMQLAEKERSLRWCCGSTSDVHEMSVKGMIDPFFPSCSQECSVSHLCVTITVFITWPQQPAARR